MGLRNELTSLALIAAVVVLIYAQTATHEFQPEDFSYVRMVAAVRTPSHLGALLRLPIPRRPNLAVTYYRPVVLLAFLAQHLSWGDHAGGYHLTSTTAHLLTAWAVYWALRRLRFGMGALLGALLFATHPLQVETVCFVTAVTEILAALFAVLCFRLYSQSNSGLLHYFASLCCFALCVLTKEPAVTLPAALLAWDLLCSGISMRKAVLRSLPFLVLAAAYVALRLTILHPLHPEHLAQTTWPRPVEGLLRAAGFILQVVWLPRNLYIDYPLDLIQPARAATLLIVTALACAAVGLMVGRRNRRGFLFGWIWAAVGLAPLVAAYWGRVSVDIDPYLYTPAFGVILSLVIALRGAKRHRTAIAACAVVGLCEFAALSTAQCVVWAKEEYGYRAKRMSAIRSEPGRDLALAVHYSRMGRVRLAQRLARELSTVPEVGQQASHLLAECTVRQGGYAEAERTYRQILEQHPDDVTAELRLIAMLIQLRKLDAAARIARKLIRQGRMEFDATVLLGDILVAQGDALGAAELLGRAVQMDVPGEAHRRARLRLEAVREQISHDR